MHQGVAIYHVSPVRTTAQTNAMLNKRLRRSQISTIVEEDADVYTETGALLLRFRKNKLNKDHIQLFYDNVISFATLPTSNRGIASGSKHKHVKHNPKIMSNILGYFDILSPSQRRILKETKQSLPHGLSVRATRFTQDFPDQFKATLPLIQNIDQLYKQYIPEFYKLQKHKASQTPFRIANTAFTTVTTNVNFQTAVHLDKGDDVDGFGNLTVIEHGEYTGGETCFPQYGIGVNVRTGDILFMDVHQPHGNLPIVLRSPEAKRLSVVCYLRNNVWKKTKGKSKQFMEKHNKTMKRVLSRPSPASS